MCFCLFSVEVPMEKVFLSGRRMDGGEDMWAHVQHAIRHRQNVLNDFGGDSYFPQVSVFTGVRPCYVMLG